MVQQSGTLNSYNGDGVLLKQIANGTTTHYVQDLAPPLSQVLQTKVGATTTSSLYGLERLASRSSTPRTWYLGDALGSVRRTLNDTGTPNPPIFYDPWGTVESGSVPTFGFTGEMQDVAAGLVNLRARWYSTAKGTFTSRDPFAGDPEQPCSMHPYQYAYSDPVLLTDPTGWIPEQPGLGTRYTYSCNCGWIDWHHARPEGHTANIIEAVGAAIEFFDDPMNQCKSYYLIDSTTMDHHTGIKGIILHTTPNYVAIPRGKVTRSNRLQVAMGIFRWVEENLESAQWPTNTSYSEEDLPSDLLAFYSAANGETNAGYKDLIDDYCKIPAWKNDELQDIFDASVRNGWQTVKEWEKPNLSLNIECINRECGGPGSRSWPSKFKTIQPLPGGTLDLWWAEQFLIVSPQDQDKTWLVVQIVG